MTWSWEPLWVLIRAGIWCRRSWLPLRMRLRQMGCNLAGKNMLPCTWTLASRISARCWQLIHKTAEMDHSGMRWLRATSILWLQNGKCKWRWCPLGYFQKGLESEARGYGLTETLAMLGSMPALLGSPPVPALLSALTWWTPVSPHISELCGTMPAPTTSPSSDVSVRQAEELSRLEDKVGHWANASKL